MTQQRLNIGSRGVADENFCSTLCTNTKFWLKTGSKQKLALYIKTYLCFCSHLTHKILNIECSFYCVSEHSWIRPRKPAYVGTSHDKFHTYRKGRTERVLLVKSPSFKHEVARILWTQRVHYRAHNSLQSVHVLSQIKPVYAYSFYSFTTHF
jgi:hypothetical protein